MTCRNAYSAGNVVYCFLLRNFLVTEHVLVRATHPLRSRIEWLVFAFGKVCNRYDEYDTHRRIGSDES